MSTIKASNEFEKAILTYLDEVKNTRPEIDEALKKEGKTLTDLIIKNVPKIKEAMAPKRNRKKSKIEA